MAQIEMNMLSVITCGSISLRVFCPGMDKLFLDDSKHEKKYPVLWLLHTEGGAAVDWLETPADRIAEKFGIFVIAPDLHHTLCTDMAYGPRFEHFMNTELLGICRNCLPLSDDPKDNWIGGVGTGAYGAVKMVLKHPETFSKAVAINGVLDMEAIIAKALKGEDTGITHNQESLSAVFGKLDQFAGSQNDLYALAAKGHANPIYLTWEKNCGYEEENRRLAQMLGCTAVEMEEEADFCSCQQSLPAGVRWLLQ